TLPSACRVTAIFLLDPASASSAALSMTSCTMCRGLSVRVYMPGRWRTGSSPLSTWMDASSYRELVNFAPLPIFRKTPILRSKTSQGKNARTILDTIAVQYRRKPQRAWPVLRTDADGAQFVGYGQQDGEPYDRSSFYAGWNFPYSPSDTVFTSTVFSLATKP